MASPTYRWPTGKVKLTDEDVRTIRKRVEKGQSKYSIAREHHVCWATIQNVVLGRCRFASII